MCDHHRIANSRLERRRRERRPERDRDRRRRRRRRAGRRSAANSNDSGEELREHDAADHRQDQQRVAVEGEPLRLRDEAPLERPGDRDEHDHRDDVLHRRDRRPDRAVERRIDRIVSMSAAGDDVRGPDRQQDEAPEDARVHQPRPPVLEHLRLDEGVLDQALEPRRDLAERPRLDGRRRRRGEDPQVAGHREDEDHRRSPEERRRPAGTRGRRRRPGRSFVLVGLDCGVRIADRVAAARRPWRRRPRRRGRTARRASRARGRGPGRSPRATRARPSGCPAR